MMMEAVMVMMLVPEPVGAAETVMRPTGVVPGDAVMRFPAVVAAVM
jgi:hypothetical protein